MIEIYPVSIEAMDEDGACVFKLQAFDNLSATLEVNGVITCGNVNEFCNALKRAVATLELGNDGDEEHPFQRLYDQSELDAAIAEALNERESIHSESSRIYARLASALRNGVDDLTVGKLLRDEVRQREEK